MLDFRQRALHYVPRAPIRDGWEVLRDPEERGANLFIRPREKPSMRRSWLHLDLHPHDQQGEVERLVKLGATRYL